VFDRYSACQSQLRKAPQHHHHTRWAIHWHLFLLLSYQTTPTRGRLQHADQSTQCLALNMQHAVGWISRSMEQYPGPFLHGRAFPSHCEHGAQPKEARLMCLPQGAPTPWCLSPSLSLAHHVQAWHPGYDVHASQHSSGVVTGTHLDV
jgi:hypothetical protein